MEELWGSAIYLEFALPIANGYRFAIVEMMEEEGNRKNKGMTNRDVGWLISWCLPLDAGDVGGVDGEFWISSPRKQGIKGYETFWLNSVCFLLKLLAIHRLVECRKIDTYEQKNGIGKKNLLEINDLASSWSAVEHVVIHVAQYRKMLIIYLWLIFFIIFRIGDLVILLSYCVRYQECAPSHPSRNWRSWWASRSNGQCS